MKIQQWERKTAPSGTARGNSKAKQVGFRKFSEEVFAVVMSSALVHEVQPSDHFYPAEMLRPLCLSGNVACRGSPFLGATLSNNFTVK